MAQIKEEKLNDTSMNGPNIHHGPNANHKQKDEFHGGIGIGGGIGMGRGGGGRGNRFQPYGGPNRDRKGPRDNNMVILFSYTYSIIGYGLFSYLVNLQRLRLTKHVIVFASSDFVFQVN